MPHAPKPDREIFALPLPHLRLSGRVFRSIHIFAARRRVLQRADGNLVLFFLNLTGGNWADASHYLYSLLAYVAGILVSLALPLLFRRRAPHAFVTALEMAAFIALAFIPAAAPDWYTYVSVSFLCALQYNTLTECRGAKLATTFCTNNLRQMTIHLFDAAKNRSAAPAAQGGHLCGGHPRLCGGGGRRRIRRAVFRQLLHPARRRAAASLPALFAAAPRRARPRAAARRPGRRGQK